MHSWDIYLVFPSISCPRNVTLKTRCFNANYCFKTKVNTYDKLLIISNLFSILLLYPFSFIFFIKKKITPRKSTDYRYYLLDQMVFAFQRSLPEDNFRFYPRGRRLSDLKKGSGSLRFLMIRTTSRYCLRTGPKCDLYV